MQKLRTGAGQIPEGFWAEEPDITSTALDVSSPKAVCREGKAKDQA